MDQPSRDWFSWWPPASFVLGGLLAWLANALRNRAALTRSVDSLKQELLDHVRNEDKTLAQIQSELAEVRTAVLNIRSNPERGH